MSVKDFLKNSRIILYFRILHEKLQEVGLLTKYIANGNRLNDKNKLLTDLAIRTHAIEKGMSIGSVRVGFGQPKTMSLLHDLQRYLTLGGSKDFVSESCSVINKYITFNEDLGADMTAVKAEFDIFCKENKIDLIDKGYLDIRSDENSNLNKEEIFKNKNLVLIKTDKAEDDLFEYEKFLIKWMLDKYGNGKEVLMGDIHKNLINNINEEQPNKLFLEWQGLVLVAFPIKKYYKMRDNNSKTWIYTIFFLLGMFPIIPGYGQVLAIYGLGCLTMANPKCILNKLGIEEKDGWLDLKKYLLDFSNIQDKSIEMIKVWNFYLTYSLVLDINTKANQEIEEFIGEEIYRDFPEKIINNEENKILIQRLKLIENDEIEKLINNELDKYKV